MQASTDTRQRVQPRVGRAAPGSPRPRGASQGPPAGWMPACRPTGPPACLAALLVSAGYPNSTALCTLPTLLCPAARARHRQAKDRFRLSLGARRESPLPSSSHHLSTVLCTSATLLLCPCPPQVKDRFDFPWELDLFPYTVEGADEADGRVRGHSGRAARVQSRRQGPTAMLRVACTATLLRVRTCGAASEALRADGSAAGRGTRAPLSRRRALGPRLRRRPCVRAGARCQAPQEDLHRHVLLIYLSGTAE